MHLKIALIFLLISCAQQCQSAKILIMYPSPSKSHLVIGQAVSKELARRGHKVTVVSSYPLDKQIDNYRDIFIEPTENFQDSMVKDMLDDDSSGSVMKLMENLPKMLRLTGEIGEAALLDKKFQKIMAEESFDLVIVGFFMQNFLLGVADHFKCPSIILNPVGAITAVNTLIGNPLGVSGVPSMMLQYKEPMTFFQRVKNFLVFSIEFMINQATEIISKQYYDKNFPSDKYISYKAAKNNISLVIANHHFSEGGVRPNVPAMIEVGGLQVKAKPNPLPEKIQKFIDEAENGVILFSLGSNAKSTYLSESKVNALLRTFSTLKQRVIWKWESDFLPGKPDNVLIGKWLPQDDILAHPNVKLFLSHGGLGSIVESKFHGVPIIAFPIFGDQMANAEAIMQEGWALSIPLKVLNENDLSKAIKEVLGTPKYTENVKRLSELYKDRPATGMDTAIYWIEYVIRHRGAPHLRYPAADLNFFQYYSLDVFAFLIFTPYYLFKILAFLFNLMKRKKTQKPTERQKKE